MFRRNACLLKTKNAKNVYVLRQVSGHNKRKEFWVARYCSNISKQHNAQYISFAVFNDGW